MYSYGCPHAPQPDDPRFATLETAIKAAMAAKDEGVLAVWEDEDGECLALVFEGDVWTR